jgi:DNA polymerase-3 subunit gamma/tau
MAGYLVLARKYRSTTFDEVVGQEPIAQTLKNAIATGRIAHAYLFTGTRGVGKTTMARILAKALNCLFFDGPTVTPCGTCDACVAIARGDDVDVVEIDGASNRGIDEIRELRANAIFRPARSRYKIYYIDEVHMLTKEAFNALLKTLEEPPEHVKFIFATTETEKVPATILSRCQRYDFRNIPTRLIAGHLSALCKAEKVAADEDALFRVARAAAGSMRDGLSLLDQLMAAGGGKVTDADVVRVLGTPSDERVLAVAQAIAGGNAATALAELSAVLESGVTLTTAVAALGDIFRNLMIAATCGAASELLELPDTQRQAVGELAKKFSIPALVQAVGILQAAAYKVRGSSVARAVVEATVVRLAAADQFVDPTSLLERLEALESGDVKKNSTPRPGLSVSRLSAPASASGVYSATSPAPSRDSGSSGVAPSQSSALVSIQWDSAWLAANWPAVLDRLAADRQMQAVGLLRPARVTAFDGSTLRLAFDPAHESLRLRLMGPIKDSVEGCLAKLAGKPIRCEAFSTTQAAQISPAFPAASAVSAGRAAAPAGPSRPAFGDLSTDEKSEIRKDPAVQAVTDLFGGDVLEMKRDANANGAGEEERTN